MLQGVGKQLGVREQQRIAAKTGLDPQKIAQIAKRQGLVVKGGKGAQAEQINQGVTNEVEGNPNGENGTVDNNETDWSSRFDELNAQWEERFSSFENMFNQYQENDNKRHDEVTKKMEDLRTDSNFDTGSLGTDNTGAGNKYENNLERLFKDSSDDPTVMNPASTGYASTAGSGGSRDDVNEFKNGSSPNGAYVNDPRDYYNSGTVGAQTTIDLDDPNALMKRSAVARKTTAGGQELAGSALGLEV